MTIRAPFITVHQQDVTECDSLDDALRDIDESRKDYHQGHYRVYDFEGGIYQQVDEHSAPKVKLTNQNQYNTRRDDKLKPFAVVDKRDNLKLIGTKADISGIGPVVFTEDNLPQLKYRGYDNFVQARMELIKRRDNDAGLYSLIIFQKVIGPDRKT